MKRERIKNKKAPGTNSTDAYDKKKNVVATLQKKSEANSNGPLSCRPLNGVCSSAFKKFQDRSVAALIYTPKKLLFFFAGKLFKKLPKRILEIIRLNFLLVLRKHKVLSEFKTFFCEHLELLYSSTG